jgi:hypothetical protein
VKIERRYTLSFPRRRVWETLLDPEVMARCLPGCEKFEPLGPDKYAVTVKLGVAAVSGTYTGTVEVCDKVAPESYRLRGEGKGAPGWARGEALLRFSDSDGKTEVVTSADVSVGGTIAGVGQRMLEGVSKVMVQQFFEALEKELSGQKVRITFLGGILGWLRTAARMLLEALRPKKSGA